MNIGIDIDGVIAKDSIQNWMKIISFRYPGFETKSPLQYSVENYTGLPTGELLDYFAEGVKEIEPNIYEGCLEVINFLLSQGHRIYIITSREERLFSDTVKWLTKHKIMPRCKLVFCNKKTISKAEFCKENNITIAIDDNPSEYVNSDTPNTVLLFSQTWNHTANLNNRFVIVNNWSEVEEEIKNCEYLISDMEIKN